MTDCDDNKVWVIKDDKNKITDEYSICKTDENMVAYISYHTFGQGCRAYNHHEKALEGLCKLDKAKINYGFDINFHSELVNWDDLIEEHIKFRQTKKNNIILIEKQIKSNKIAV